MSDKVSFTAMEHGTKADYDLAYEHDVANVAATAGRVIEWLQQMDCASPYQVTRLGHSLQTATRAERDGADDEMIVCALLHDIGDLLVPANHSQVAAALLALRQREKPLDYRTPWNFPGLLLFSPFRAGPECARSLPRPSLVRGLR